MKFCRGSCCSCNKKSPSHKLDKQIDFRYINVPKNVPIVTVDLDQAGYFQTRYTISRQELAFEKISLLS